MPPRKAQPVGRLRRKGAIKPQAMFRKQRNAMNLKAGSADTEVWVGFSGRAARIARVHQEGLDDIQFREGKPARSAKRVLLSDTEAERRALLDIVFKHIDASPLGRLSLTFPSGNFGKGQSGTDVGKASAIGRGRCPAKGSFWERYLHAIGSCGWPHAVRSFRPSSLILKRPRRGRSDHMRMHQCGEARRLRIVIGILK